MTQVARIFCIGRNYAQHAKELDNPIPSSPVVFIKPLGCLLPVGKEIVYPTHGQDLQHEVEVAVKIADKTGKVAAVTLALDLTLRDIQTSLKAKGLPWELAKSFEGSVPIGNWINYDDIVNLQAINFYCSVNGQLRQIGNTQEMLFSIESLINYIGSIWSFVPGDIILTGTPVGVGSLEVGDKVSIFSPCLGHYEWLVTG